MLEKRLLSKDTWSICESLKLSEGHQTRVGRWRAGSTVSERHFFLPTLSASVLSQVKTLTSVLCQGSRESIYLGWDAASTTSWHPLG